MRDATPGDDQQAARRDEQRLRELARQSGTAAAAAGALGVRARHSWYGSGTVPIGSAWVSMGSWTADENDGIATMPSAGVFVLGNPGVWAVSLEVYSDGGAAGNFGILLRPSDVSLFNDVGDLRATGYTGAGFAGAGYDDRVLSWAGPVSSDQAPATITPLARWLTASTTATRTVAFRLALNLLGGAAAT